MADLKATRDAYGEGLAELAERYPDFYVLDADLAKATKTITLECEEITEEMVTVIKVVKCDGNSLHLDFNGEIRIFEK